VLRNRCVFGQVKVTALEIGVFRRTKITMVGGGTLCFSLTYVSARSSHGGFSEGFDFHETYLDFTC